jgi:iron complex outermembrane receptor protein
MNAVNLSWKLFIASSVFVAGVFIVPLSMSAQQAAAVSGTVLDQAQKVLPSATVTLHNEATGATINVKSDNEGHFSAPNVSPGSYTIEISAPGFASSKRAGFKVSGSEADASVTLAVANLSQAVTVEGSINSVASQAAPSQSTLDATSARSEISEVFIDNFISPVSDFSEIILMSPGTFSVNTNGVGLGQAKDYFRGFADGDYTVTFDGIPFEDTNTPTHHTWAFFPAQWIGGTDFDRSPGAASDIGPTNFGGSINLLSREVQADMNIQATASYGSFNTRLAELDFDSGQFGPGKKSSFLADVHQLLSDGYQTDNKQKRDAGSLKYQYKVSDKTVITLFTGVLDLWTNTPNQNGPTRAQIAEYGDNFLLSSNPNSPLYWPFNYYDVQTDFEYGGITSDLGHGWRLDNKLYTYRYWNKQNYKSTTTISKTSAVDKLNGYRKAGDTLSVSQDTHYGTLRIGAWYEWSYTDRYQVPNNPLTGLDTVLPNFHEHFITQAIQPFVDYQYHVTRRLTFRAGIKPAYYNIALDQFADNGKTVGNLGGAAFVRHQAGYTSWLPSGSLRYRLKDNWSAYFQYGKRQHHSTQQRV